jgi:hypothetical protein
MQRDDASLGPSPSGAIDALRAGMHQPARLNGAEVYALRPRAIAAAWTSDRDAVFMPAVSGTERFEILGQGYLQTAGPGKLLSHGYAQKSKGTYKARLRQQARAT